MKITIQFDTDNEAFIEPCGALCVSGIEFVLEQAVRRIRNSEGYQKEVYKLLDINGNSVGTVGVEP